MSIRILKPGLLTSLQDLGRPGHMHMGIAHGGAMDKTAMQLANWLVDNPPGYPLLEITLIGPVLEFGDSMSIAIVGAEFDCFLNGELVFNNQTIQVKRGDLLEFEHLNAGARAYLSVGAQLKLQSRFGSYATHLAAGFGGHKGRELEIGDKLKTKYHRQVTPRQLPDHLQYCFSGNYLLRCVSSVETDAFDQPDRELFFSHSYQVSPDSNRMGIRLKGEPLLHSDIAEVVSSGLIQGSIQVPPSGQPIISSVDGQTVGGYPRIANIISADLPVLGQLRANDKLSFHQVDEAFALAELRDRERLISELYA